MKQNPANFGFTFTRFSRNAEVSDRGSRRTVAPPPGGRQVYYKLFQGCSEKRGLCLILYRDYLKLSLSGRWQLWQL